MIAHLSGRVLAKSPVAVLLDVGGVGYEAYVPLSTLTALPEPGDKADLHIHTHVREDAIALYGFHTLIEKEIFLLLIAVTGIGPRLAMNVLSGIGPEELLRALSGGDAARLRGIPGVGKKTAERMVLELKEKACEMAARKGRTSAPAAREEDTRLEEDVLSALVNLGYSQKQAELALERVVPRKGTLGLEGLIREALKLLA